jgi:hypothetical protein
MRSSGRRGADSWSGDTIGESVQKTPGSDTRRQSCFFFFLVSDLSDLANPPGGTRPLFGCQVVKSDACRPLAGEDRRYWVLRATAAHQSRQTRGMAPDRTGSLPGAFPTMPHGRAGSTGLSLFPRCFSTAARLATGGATGGFCGPRGLGADRSQNGDGRTPRTRVVRWKNQRPPMGLRPPGNPECQGKTSKISKFFYMKTPARRHVA